MMRRYARSRVLQKSNPIHADGILKVLCIMYVVCRHVGRAGPVAAAGYCDGVVVVGGGGGGGGRDSRGRQEQKGGEDAGAWTPRTRSSPAGAKRQSLGAVENSLERAETSHSAGKSWIIPRWT